RHLDLGDDRDVPDGGVRHELAHLLLSVEATVGRAIADVGIEVLPYDGLLPPGAHLGEARVPLDLQPPALVVRQMQVEGIELVEGEEVDELLDELRRVEPARHVQENAAIAEAGRVIDLDGGDDPPRRRRRRVRYLRDASPPPIDRADPTLQLRWEELPERLKPVD